MPDYIRKCKNDDCNKIFKSDIKNVEYCSAACGKHVERKRLQAAKKAHNDELYKDVPDIPTCKICGFKSINLINHITQVHKLKQKKYMRMYKAKVSDIYHHSYTSQVQKKGGGDIAICKLCGDEFVKTSPNQAYCPGKCTEEGLRTSKYAREKELDQLEKEGKHTPSPTRDRTCKQCGKDYTTKHPNSKFCSIKCRNKWFNSRKSAGKTKECRHCKKEIPVGKKRYCSKTCKDAAKYEKLMQRRIKASIEKYKDNPNVPTCKICGFRGKNIHRHIQDYHKTTADAYCKRFGVERSSLICQEMFEVIRVKNKITFDRKYKEYINRTRGQPQDKY